MKVLVTGALGFIGSHIAEAFLNDGHDVVGLDDLSGNVVDDIDGITFRQRDVRDRIVGKVDLVVHAASPVGAVALLDRGSIVAEIVEGTQSVLEFCDRVGAPLINISSSEVYGFSGVYHENDDCVIPHRLSHRIQYAAGKIAAEHLVRTSGLMACNVRPFNVAGPRQTAAKGFVLPTFCEQALAREALTVFETGFQERSFTAVWDVVGFITHLAALRAWPEVVNVGNPDNRTTVLDLAHRTLDVLSATGEIAFTSGKQIHGPEYEEARGVVKVPDITAARSIGWQPVVGLDEMIIRTADEIRQEVTIGGQ